MWAESPPKRPGKVLRQRYADAGLAVQKSAEPEGYGQDSCNISSSSRNHFAALPENTEIGPEISRVPKQL